MQYKLHTIGHFDSAHFLKGYKGKCSQTHGHSFKVEVWIVGSKLDKIGILWDFNNLDIIINKLDHKHLNNIMKENPTAENISKLIYTTLKKSSPNLRFKVRLYESENSWCEIGDINES